MPKKKSIDWYVKHVDTDWNPTDWVAYLNGKKIYMERTYKGTYGLSDTQDVYTPYIKECKTVTAAKRWATMYQNRFFLDKDE